MFKKLKRVKTLFIKRIASGNQSTTEAFFFTNYIGFGDKKNNKFKRQRKLQSGGYNEYNKSRIIAQKEIKIIENRNYISEKFFLFVKSNKCNECMNLGYIKMPGTEKKTKRHLLKWFN